MQIMRQPRSQTDPDDLREDSVDFLQGGLVLEGGAVIIGGLTGGEGECQKV